MEKKYKLPKEFAEKWVDALRSRRYNQRQGSYYSKYDKCYCAMGVGLKQIKFKFNANETPDNSPFCKWTDDGSCHTYLWHAIVKLNDTDKKTFTEIADWIEANVEFVENKEGGE